VQATEWDHRLAVLAEGRNLLGHAGVVLLRKVADRVGLASALRQLPLPLWSKLLVRIDGAAFSHDVLDHLQSLTTSRRRVRWVTGWAINEVDEQAIALLPEKVWTAALRQDGAPHDIKGPDGEWISYQVAELTGVRDLTGWPEGMRLIVRRGKPSRRDAKKLTAFEKRTGWRYQIIATNIPSHQGLSGVPGSGQVWFVDGLYRDHAEVEDRVKAIKRVGLGLLPSKSWQLNAAWVLAATLAADLDAWTRLLLLHDEPELAAAQPQTIRMKLYRLPARLTTHTRRGPCTSTGPGPGRPRSPPPGDTPPSSRPSLDGRPPPRQHREDRTAPPRARGPRRSRSACEGPCIDRPDKPGQDVGSVGPITPRKNRGWSPRRWCIPHSRTRGCRRSRW